MARKEHVKKSKIPGDLMNVNRKTLVEVARRSRGELRHTKELAGLLAAFRAVYYTRYIDVEKTRLVKKSVPAEDGKTVKPFICLR